MAAYAALVSLTKVIDLTLSQKQEYVLPYSREQMMSLREELGRLQDLLEHLSGRSHSSIDVLESRIRDVAYQLEDIIEGNILCIEDYTPSVEEDIPTIKDDTSSSLFVKVTSFLFLRSSRVEKTATTQSPAVITTPSTFDSCAREVDILLEESMAMKENNLQDKDASRASHPFTTGSSSSEPPSTKLDFYQNKRKIMYRIFGRGMKENSLQDKDTSGASHPFTAGSSSSELPSAELDFNQKELMDWIFRRSSNLEIVPITGMGGIGKTTLARAVYEHPNTTRHFDICSWVTVSQEYSVNEILRGLLPPEQQNAPDERLIEFVHKRLTGRAFLIVLDDMWDVKAWDGVMNAFHGGNKGSCIIVTTRLSGVAEYVGSSSHVHEMQLLKDEQCWSLLQEKVGGNKHLSEELEDLGRTISRNCRGLPLAVVAMAGLLKFNMTEEYWERVARDTKSETVGNDYQFSGILSLSYTNLPHYLKACFLYFGIFKEDYEIPAEELVRLWIAEGFLKPRGSKEMEDVAEEYLEELVARNLVLVKKRLGGRIKTCSIHDVLRDLSLRKAQEEIFCHHITSSSSMDSYSSHELRRVIIGPGCSTVDPVHHKHIRSIQFDSDPWVLSAIRHLRLIRVLGTIRSGWYDSELSNLYQLSNLRYLHILHNNVNSRTLAIHESLSKLQNLETLICSSTFQADRFFLPPGIWEMPRLKHIILPRGSRLACSALSKTSCAGLQTLTGVTNFNLTWSMTRKLSNLKKLKLYYSYSFRDGDETVGVFGQNIL